MKKPNLKLMQSVHTEARITAQSSILKVLSDVDNFDFFTHRMIEAIRMAQTDKPNADTHLCLVAQLCTIARTKLREDSLADQLKSKIDSPPGHSPVMDEHNGKP